MYDYSLSREVIYHGSVDIFVREDNSSVREDNSSVSVSSICDAHILLQKYITSKRPPSLVEKSKSDIKVKYITNFHPRCSK